MSTNDLTRRIRAVLDEDERTAQAARNELESDWWWSDAAESAAERHISRNEPRRTIDVIAALRWVVALPQCGLWLTGGELCLFCRINWPCESIRRVAKACKVEVRP